MAEREKIHLNEIHGKRNALGLGVPNYFNNGITDQPRDYLMTMFGRQDPSSSWFQDFDDFTKYAAGDWTITSTGSPTHALAAGAGGVLSVTNSNGSSDIDSFQRAAASCYLIAGKQAFFRARFQESNIDMGVYLGLQIVGTDPSAPSDGIYFQKAGTGAMTLKVIAAAASNTVSSTLVTVVASTWHVVTFYYDGFSTLLASVDDAQPVKVVTTNVPGPTIALAPTFGVKNTSGNARVLLLDYMLAAIQR